LAGITSIFRTRAGYSGHLNLVEVVLQFVQNNKKTCQTWIAHNGIGPVAADTAQRWFNEAREL